MAKPVEMFGLELGLQIWNHPEVIDSYCEDGAKNVLDYVETMLKGLRRIIEETYEKVQLSCVALTMIRIESESPGLATNPFHALTVIHPRPWLQSRLVVPRSRKSTISHVLTIFKLIS